MTPLIKLDQAATTRDGNGLVTVDDPDSPVLVTVRMDGVRLVELTVRARQSGRLHAASIARIPIAQITRTALRTMLTWHPNEAAIVATLDTKTGRSWDREHWRKVLDVCTWAEETNRPGGGPQAIADLWSVTVNPTARRWIRKAHEELDGDST